MSADLKGFAARLSGDAGTVTTRLKLGGLAIHSESVPGVLDTRAAT